VVSFAKIIPWTLKSRVAALFLCYKNSAEKQVKRFITNQKDEPESFEVWDKQQEHET
jgi:hypothetical protein